MPSSGQQKKILPIQGFLLYLLFSFANIQTVVSKFCISIFSACKNIQTLFLAYFLPAGIN